MRVPKAEADKARELFAIHKTTEIDEKPEEFAFVTKEMSEKAFADACAKLSVIASIRYE